MAAGAEVKLPPPWSAAISAVVKDTVSQPSPTGTTSASFKAGSKKATASSHTAMTFKVHVSSQKEEGVQAMENIEGPSQSSPQEVRGK